MWDRIESEDALDRESEETQSLSPFIEELYSSEKQSPRPAERPRDNWRGDSVEARDQRVEDAARAVRNLETNGNQWYVLRSRLVEEYESGGTDPARCERNLRQLIDRVNRELGDSGRITFERLTGRLADLIADGTKPDAVLGFRVRHSGGTLGPIGVPFKAKR